jgi:ribonuclease HI
VCVHTDSKYAIDCVTNWFVNWRKRGWKNAQGKPVENKELIEEILKIIDDRYLCRAMTNFEWVKGHVGHPENEEADRLAVAGAIENQQKGINHSGNVAGANGSGGETSAIEDEFGDDGHDQFMDAHEDMSMAWNNLVRH